MRLEAKKRIAEFQTIEKLSSFSTLRRGKTSALARRLSGGSAVRKERTGFPPAPE